MATNGIKAVSENQISERTVLSKGFWSCIQFDALNNNHKGIIRGYFFPLPILEYISLFLLFSDHT